MFCDIHNMRSTYFDILTKNWKYNILCQLLLLFYTRNLRAIESRVLDKKDA